MFSLLIFRRSLPLNKLTLQPKEGMVLAFVPDFGKTKAEEEIEALEKPVEAAKE